MKGKKEIEEREKENMKKRLLLSQDKCPTKVFNYATVSSVSNFYKISTEIIIPKEKPQNASLSLLYIGIFHYYVVESISRRKYEKHRNALRNAISVTYNVLVAFRSLQLIPYSGRIRGGII